MQTLNVGAGQSDQEYRVAEEKRRTDLRDDSLSDANLFFWAAGLAALGTGLLPIHVNFLVSIGVVDLLTYYGQPLGAAYEFTVLGTAAIWFFLLIALGFAARTGRRWAFFTGMVLYAVDMFALGLLFSLWAFGVHAFFVFKWFQGQQKLKDLKQASVFAS